MFLFVFTISLCIFVTNKFMIKSKILDDFYLQKVKEMILYILDKTGDIDYYKLMKILFCSDRNNLLVWAEPITNLVYTAKEHGPVPLSIYKMIVRSGSGQDNSLDDIITRLDEFIVHGKRKPNMDYISQTDVEAMDPAISYLKDKDYKDIEKELHEKVFFRLFPLKKAYSLTDIAETAGADKKTLQRIVSNEKLNRALA